jgi:hypothetical protein
VKREYFLRTKNLNIRPKFFWFVQGDSRQSEGEIYSEIERARRKNLASLHLKVEAKKNFASNKGQLLRK